MFTMQKTRVSIFGRKFQVENLFMLLGNQITNDNGKVRIEKTVEVLEIELSHRYFRYAIIHIKEQHPTLEMNSIFVGINGDTCGRLECYKYNM